VGSCLRSLVVLAGFALACDIQERPPRAPAVTTGELILRIPPDSEIPAGVMGAAIRRGRALLADTPDSLPAHVGSDLRCFSCHLLEGTKAGALPLIGVYSRFPQYRSRNGLINLLEDRINDCFERSLNGTALPRTGREMREIVAYFAFISRGIAPPGLVPGGGLDSVAADTPDTVRGAGIFASMCARCHGPSGLGTGAAPPLSGPRSFNIGAGMARLWTAAAFIRHNMPNDGAVTLTDQQAADVASYVISRPRPDFAAKALDWPNGNPPPDVAYPTRGASGKAVPPNNR